MKNNIKTQTGNLQSMYCTVCIAFYSFPVGKSAPAHSDPLLTNIPFAPEEQLQPIWK